MFYCNNCNKRFKYESDYIRHENRKTQCGKPKENLECKLCNVKFNCKTEKIRYEKSKKHIININNDYNPQISNLESQISNLNLQILDLTSQLTHLTNENTILNNKIKNLECENQNLKNNNKIHSNAEFIYIIHSAQHINTNIYKIRRTKNLMNRFRQYPKGSELLFSINCKNSTLIESKILSYLKSNTNNYNLYKDAGNEYFQCDLENLKSDIYNIINS